MNSNTVLQGLTITAAGMGLVFLALGLLVIAMRLMTRYLRPPATASKEMDQREPALGDRARIAAIAAALVLAQAHETASRGQGWDSADRAGSSSPWQAAHRAQALARRPDPTRGGERHQWKSSASRSKGNHTE